MATPLSTRDPLIGRNIDGRYTIERRLGTGGMGVVYLARQLQIDREVAIKVLKPGRHEDESALAQFLVEARAVSQLTSPHTVTLFDVGRLDAGYYMVMEHLDGRTLAADMAGGGLFVPRAIQVIDEIALSLAEAHALGIVHRDIKPHNVMLVPTRGDVDRVKVVDFGLALLDGTGGRGRSTAGTPLYMAPESLQGFTVDARADVYALAMIAYELLAGGHPFADLGGQELVDAQLETLPPPLDEVCETPPPPPVVELLARALAKPPRLRPASGREFRRVWAAAYGSARTSEPDDCPPVSGTTVVGTRFQTVAEIALTRAKEHFVGRRAELAALEATLHDRKEEPRVVAVHGAPGVGKTALAKMTRLCAEADRHRVYWLSCAHIQPTRPGVFEALAQIGLPSGLRGLGHAKRRDLLVVDALEHLGSQASWLLTDELMRAGPRAMLLTTSREPLGPDVTQDVALAPFLNVVTLEPLSLDESTDLLTAYEVDPAMHERLFALTQGHALSLSLLASNKALHADIEKDEVLPSALVATLARELLRHITDRSKRVALYCLGIASALDEGVLAAMLDDADEAARLYPWLSAQSFVTPTDGGLAPHELVRESLFEELRQRDPFLMETLSKRACLEIAKRMRGVPIERQRFLAFQGLYARRVNPVTEALVQSQRMGRTYLDRGNDEDAHASARVISRFESTTAARAFLAMCALQPSSFFVVRSADCPREGMSNSFLIDTQNPPPLDDPPTAKACAVAAERGITSFHCIRFACSFESGQRFSPSIAAVFFSGPEITASFDPVSRYSIIVATDPHRLEEYAGRTFLRRIEGADVHAAGVHYGLWLLDLRRIGDHDDYRLLCASAMPMMLAGLAGIVEDATDAPDYLKPPAPRTRPFFEAVRAAFEHLHHPERLRDSPLLQVSWLARERHKENALAALLVERVAALQRDKQLGGLGDVLAVTYVEPNDEAPAARLSLPWGTYKSRLNQALEVVADELASVTIGSR